MAQIPPIPVISPWTQSGPPVPAQSWEQGQYLSGDAYRWLSQLVTVAGSAPSAYPKVSIAGQGAAITTVNIPLPSLSAGDYSVAYYARVTTPDGAGSSLTVSLGWTESAVSLAFSGSAMTGDTTTTVQSGNVIVRVDGGTPITYATAYSSTTPGKMRYRLDVVVSQL